MTKPATNVALLLSLMLSLCLVLSASAQEPAFKATLKKTKQGSVNAPGKGEKELTEILVQLEMIYDVTFAYQKKYLSGKFAVYKPLIGIRLDDYLGEILYSLKLGFKKIESDNKLIYVILPLRELAAADVARVFGDSSSMLPLPSRKSISGIVTNADGSAPLAAVNILLKGATEGTITDAEGKFTIDLPSFITAENTLIFSHIGFFRKELNISPETEMHVTMQENIQSLTEVVVTAMGIQRDQKSIGYSVSTVVGGQIDNTGNTNFASALYGKIPGVRIRTAPGGATSAVTVQIRGFNSLNYNTQPHYIIDGVPIRDSNEKGAAGINNDGFFADQRIRGNGILDINPADIETITVLKGASATALYGSDASNGAVVITTKRGLKKTGMGVDINYNFALENVAFTPRYQNVYGPGYDRETNLTLGATAEGWRMVDTDGDGAGDTRSPLFRAYGQFGPKMDGQPVLWWDGSTQSYSPQPDNYNDFYRQGYNSQFNVALQNKHEKVGYRVSYSRNDYEGIQVGGQLQKNTLNANTSFRFSKRLAADWMINLTNTSIHNRPYKINRLTDSYSGFFSRAEKMGLFFDHYRTSDGYKWVPYEYAERNPQEALNTHVRGHEVMNLLWTQLRDSEDERQNRLISSLTLKYDLSKDFHLRARAGNDFAKSDIITKHHNEYPVVFNGASSTGQYGTSRGNYSIRYGDALLSYNKSTDNDLTIDLSAGFQVRDERYSDEIINTNGGLREENIFTFANSYHPELSIVEKEMSILKYAYMGIAGFSYKDLLFLEATGRQEHSSTLPPGHNSYFYPSVNAGFILSDVVTMPAFLNFTKFRSSFGVVGNSPPVYEANIQYDVKTLPTVSGPVTSGSPVGSLFGNNTIRPERKYEVEFGMEMRMMQNRIGLDLTYYNNRVKDQILRLDLPATTGAGRILTNVGELRGHGYEAGVNASILRRKFKWNATVNTAYSTTKVHKLMKGVNQLVFRDMEGGSIRVVAEEGEDIGNIYVYPRKKDDDGNHIINSDGFYIIDKSRYVKAGNVLPKVTGGMMNVFSFRDFALNMMMDYSFGGKMVSVSQKYNIGSGMYESTLRYRDAAHGGLAYYINGSGEKILLNDGGPAPDGSSVYYDGIILKGVTEEGQPNTKVVDAAYYYLNTFGWGNDSWNEEGSLYDNDFIKMREVVLSWSIPKPAAARLHLQKVQFSLIGRNLFYVWRTMKNLDPESSIGTTWLSQGIDEGSNAATRSYGFALNLSF